MCCLQFSVLGDTVGIQQFYCCIHNTENMFAVPGHGASRTCVEAVALVTFLTVFTWNSTSPAAVSAQWLGNQWLVPLIIRKKDFSHSSPLEISLLTSRQMYPQFLWRLLISNNDVNPSAWLQIFVIQIHHFLYCCDLSASSENPPLENITWLFISPPWLSSLSAHAHTHTHTHHLHQSFWLEGLCFSEVTEDQCWLYGVIIWGIRLAYLSANWDVWLAAAGEGWLRIYCPSRSPSEIQQMRRWWGGRRTPQWWIFIAAE